MALVSQPRPRRLGYGFQGGGPPRRRRRGVYAVVGVLVVLIVGGAAGALIISSASASLTADPQALAKVGMPLGGGKVASVFAVTGNRRIPVVMRDGRIWPKGTIHAGDRVTIDVVVQRPGWISWLAGGKDRLRL